MQLKTVGESLDVNKTINDILRQISYLNNGFANSAIKAHKLSEGLKNYSTEAVKIALSQSKLNKTIIQAILSSKGLKGELLETTTAQLVNGTSTDKLSASQTKATLSTNSFGLAIKGLGENIKNTGTALKTFILTNPIAWISAAIGTVYLLNKAIQSTVETLEEQKKTLEEVQSTVNDYKNQLSSLENELQNINNKISEIGENPVNIVDQKTLSILKQERSELEQQIELVKILNAEAKDIAENTTMQILANTSKITGLTKTLDLVKNGDIFGALKSTNAGIGGILNTFENLKEKDYLGAIKSAAGGFFTNTGSPVAALYNWLYPKKENEKSIFEETKEQINELNASREELNNLNNNRLNQSISEEKYQKSLSKLNEKISEQTTTLLANIKTLQAYKDQLDATDPEQSEWIDKINETIDSYTASLVHKEDYKTFDNILSSDIYGSYKDELIQLANQGKLTHDIMDNDYHNLLVLFESLGLSVDDVAEKLRQMGEEVTDVSKNTSSISVFTLSEDQSKAIDDFQSKIKSLESALVSIQSGDLDSSALIDLQQEFPSLQNSSENLELAIRNLIDNSLQSLFGILGESLPQNMKDSLQAIADKASGLVPSLDEAFSSVQNSYKALEDFKKAMAEGMTDSVLSSVASLSDSLRDLVAGFYAGAVSADELFNALIDHYNIDLKNYSNALIAKNQFSDQFYNNTILADTKLVNQFSKNYGIDISNCKTYAEAKLKIEQECFKKVSDMWTKYYNAQTGTFTVEFDKLVRLRDQSDLGSEEWHNFNNQIDDILHAKIQYEQASKALDAIAYHGIESKFTGISSNLTKTNGTEKKESEPTIFDWIEVRIDRAKEAIDKLNDKLASVSDYTYQNQYIDETLQAYEKEIQLLEESKQKYLEKAEAVGLSAAYIEKVQNGSMEIDSVSNETTKKKIEEYQKWYEKAKEVDSSIGDILDKTKELKYQKVDNLIDDFERVTSLTEAYNNYLQKLLDVKKAKNDTVTESDYLSLIQQELNIQATLKDQYQRVQAEFDKLNLTPADDKWYDYKKQLIDIQTQIEDCTLSVENFRDTILDIRWNNFEIGTSLLDDLADEISDVISLLGNGDMFDSAGEITDLGITKIGLYAQQYVTAKKQIAEYENAIVKLGEMYKNGLYSQEEYTQKLIEFRKASRDAALAVKDAKKEILAYHKEAIQAEIDAMKELIDSKKQALDAEKDLDDYRKKIADKQKNIQSLEKKIATLSLSDARADKALKLQLEEELAKAKEELADEEKEHSIENQKDALDKEYENFEKEKNDEIKELENNLDKQEDLIKKYLNDVVDNYDIVYDNIQQISDIFGITFTENLTSPWESATGAAELYAQAVRDILSQIEINAGSIGSGITGSTLGTTNGQGQWIQETNPNSENHGKWWYKHADGSYTSSDWEKIDNTWYCFDKDGWMGQNEWVRGKSGEWYYLGADGAMLHSGWKVIDGKDYCFDEEGRLYQNGYTPDGYMVDANGVWDKSIPQTNDSELIKNKAASFDHYRTGTIKVTDAGFAYVDENGEEMVLRPDESGRLDFLTKGTGIIPADMTKRLMDIAYDPTSLLNDLPDIRNLANIQFEKTPKAEQPINLNITSPLMTVNGGLDSSIMDAVEKRINRIPDDIKQQLKSMGLR